MSGERRGARSWIAQVAAGALIAGSLVAVGIGAQQALAAGPAPEVETSTPDSYIWGEDLPVAITFTGSQGGGAQYNLSAGVVLPIGASVIDTGTLGAPIEYAAGAVLPGVIVNSGETCADLGLENAASPANACRVPAGKQYLVFQNIHDLPEGASATHTLTVRPNAMVGEFDLGESFPYQVNAYTNGNERYLPVFPGSTGVNTLPAREKSSAAGSAGESVLINGLRITKNETTHPENEVLRGVHGDRGAIYELRIEHTGQADLSSAQVIDYLPAGLEYLGSCGLDDSTTNANGTQSTSEEYPDSGPLNTAPVGDDCLGEASIETVQGSFDAYGRFTESEDGDVFTKVTWTVGDWLRGNPGGLAQTYPGTAGTPAITTIRYRAGVPLYENTMDFGASTPSADSVQQGANLDNNRGASTRHGSDDLTTRDAGAQSYTNQAIAVGEYEGTVVSDFDRETIDAVDVRVVKTVNGAEPGATGAFEQGDIARYGLALATSEYVSAVQGDPSVRPLRVVDDMANGLCPVFGPGTAIWNEADAPKLYLGGYNPYDPSTREATVADWNAALTAANVDQHCQWDTTTSSSRNAQAEDAMTGAQIVGIAFSPKTGRFYLELGLADPDVLNAPDSALNIEYSVHQNSAYIKGSETPEGGATTSRDVFENEAEINLRTTPIDDIIGVSTPGMSQTEQDRLDADWNAWDDSHASIRAGDTELEKKVLERGTVPSRDDVSKPETDGGPKAERWVDAAEQPFAAGDQTWYRIRIDPPDGADVRNPVFTDFLPEGVTFDAASLDASTGRYEDMYIVPTNYSTLPSLGTCAPTSTVDWLNTFVPNDSIELNGNVLTFELGAQGTDCGLSEGGDNRFLPFESELEIYLLVTVTDPAAFAEVDLPQNLAKYQQENNEGEIWFLRDDATIVSDRTAKLVKGVASVKDNNGDASSTRPATSQGSADGVSFNSNRDGIEVVQGEEVTYRLDVTAPFNSTEGYLIYDVLPEGIKAVDVQAGNYTARLVEGGEGAADLVDYTAQAYNPGSYPTGVNLKDEFDGRSIIVWNVKSVVPASTKADPDATPAVDAVERGLTLGYTVKVPETGTAAAQITQKYENDASIVEFDTLNNGGTPENPTKSTVIVDGSDNVAEPREPSPANPGFVFADKNNDTSDPSDVYLPGAEIVKDLISTEIKPASSAPADPNNTSDRSAATPADRPDDAIVQGEYATFEYRVTIPGKTTVANGKLADDGLFRWADNPTPPNTRQISYHFVDGSAKFEVRDETGTAVPFDLGAAGFIQVGDDTGTEKPGTLVFPTTWTNDSDKDRTFVAQITVWVEDRDESTPAYNPNFPDNKTLTNTARFGYTNPNTGSPATPLTDTADTRYLEPQPSLVKTVTNPADGIVGADGNVTFRLTAGNAANRVALYESVVLDCLPAGFGVPAGGWGFVTSQGSASISTQGDGKCRVEGTGANQRVIPDSAGTGTLIEWNVGRIDAGTSNRQSLDFTAKVDTSAGGGQNFTNRAHIKGYTLPASGTEALPDASGRRGDRATGADRKVELASAGIEKSVTTPNGLGSAPVGETVRYTLTTTLPAHANFYDVELTDTLPAGLSFAGNQNVSFTGWSANPTVGGEPTVSGQNLSWSIAPDDIALHGSVRTITIAFDAKITGSVAANATTLTNSAKFSWNKVNGDERSREEDDDTADVTILHPVLAIAKDVKFSDEGNWRQQAEGNPDRTLNYQIKVTNTGQTTSYHNVIVDTLPAGVVNPRDFTVNGIAVTAPNTAVYDAGAGTVTWTIPGGIVVGAENVRTLGYTADFADAGQLESNEAGVGDWQLNVAEVNHFESWPRDPERPSTPTGREYNPTNVQADAEARPLFPLLVPSKTVANPVGQNAAGDDYGIAYEGEAFGWVLTAVNTGAGAAQTAVLTDTLPKNWEYVAGSAQVSIGTQAAQQIDPMATPSSPLLADGQQSLTWSLGGAAPATPLLPGTAAAAAARTITITFQAIPNEHALDKAGTGIVDPADPEHPHTNTVGVTATDTRGGDGNKTGKYNGPDDTADAHIAEADLLLAKEAIGGVIGKTDTADNFLGLGTGAWVPGQAPVAGEYDQPQWRITVDNHGPDDSTGPFSFTDTVTAPTGVTTGQWAATWYPTAADAAAGTGGVDLGTHSGTSFTVGTESTVLDKGGNARIVLVANVSIPASATTATPTSLNNVATVDGRTFEKESNKPDTAENPNTDTVNKEFTTVADLTIDKTVNTVSPNAGSPLTWGITVTNLGPSVSKSPASNPITVTDTVPTGMTNVTVTQNADWVPVITRDGTVITGAAEAGDLVTWTYQKAEMPVGATAEITLSGVIVSSHTGVLSNTATVTPTETPEPDPNEPNEDTEEVTPGTDTTLGILKTRVVNVNGAWVNAADMDPVPAFVAGDPVSYRIDVTTTGRADARSVTVVDEVPAGLGYASHAGLSGSVWIQADGGTNAANVTNADWDTFSLTTPATLAAGTTQSFVVTYNTEATVTGAVVNWSEASAENSTNDPRDPDDSSSTRKADLGIAKTHTSPAAGEAAVAGESVDYRLVVTNYGPSVSTAPVTVTDTLPAGFSYQEGTAQVSVNGAAATAVAPTVANQVLTWADLTSEADLPLGATIVITFTADVDASVRAQTGLLNTADVSAPEDTNPENNHSEDPVDIVTDAVMEITKAVTDGPWIAGTDVEYTLTVQNHGPSAAPASVVDTLPVGLTLVSMDGTGWDCSTVVAGAQNGTCAYEANDGLHPVGAENATTITVLAHIAANAASLEQPLKNSAVLTWTDSEGPKTDEDDADITVTRSADLGIAKTALDSAGNETSTATAGTSLWYRLVVSNGGPSDAIAPLVVNDTLPDGMTFAGLVGESSENWSAEVDSANPQLVTFTRTSQGILNGQSAPEILFEVALDASIPVANAEGEANVLRNLAEIDRDQTLDPNGDPEGGGELPDSDIADVVIDRQIDLGIVKSHDADTVRIGDALPFTIDVTNHGPSDASGIVVTDAVPAGLEVLSEVGPVLDADGAETGWTIDAIMLAQPGDDAADPAIPADPAAGAIVTASYAAPLAPGESATPLTIETLVTAAAYDTVTNVVDVTANEPEPDPDTENPNHAEDPVVVPPMVTLITEKTAVGEFQVGKTGQFTISVENLGPTADPGPITVTDELPAGLAFRESPKLPAGTTVEVHGQQVVWTISNGLGVGEKVEFGLTVNVSQGAYPQVINTVIVDSPAEKTPDSVLTDSATAQVKAADVLAITGGDLAAFALLAALLLLLGGGAVMLAKRRRVETMTP